MLLFWFSYCWIFEKQQMRPIITNIPSSSGNLAWNNCTRFSRVELSKNAFLTRSLTRKNIVSPRNNVNHPINKKSKSIISLLCGVKAITGSVAAMAQKCELDRVVRLRCVRKVHFYLRAWPARRPAVAAAVVRRIRAFAAILLLNMMSSLWGSHLWSHYLLYFAIAATVNVNALAPPCATRYRFTNNFKNYNNI